MPLRLGRGLLGRRARRRQFFDPYVAKLDWCPLAFQREVALAIEAIVAAGNLLAVHAQADRARVGHDAVVIPFRRRLASLLARKAALAAMAPQRLHRRTMNREDI